MSCKKDALQRAATWFPTVSIRLHQNYCHCGHRKAVATSAWNEIVSLTKLKATSITLLSHDCILSGQSISTFSQQDRHRRHELCTVEAITEPPADRFLQGPPKEKDQPVRWRSEARFVAARTTASASCTWAQSCFCAAPVHVACNLPSTASFSGGSADV